MIISGSRLRARIIRRARKRDCSRATTTTTKRVVFSLKAIVRRRNTAKRRDSFRRDSGEGRPFKENYSRRKKSRNFRANKPRRQNRSRYVEQRCLPPLPCDALCAGCPIVTMHRPREFSVQMTVIRQRVSSFIYRVAADNDATARTGENVARRRQRC